ncbi:hypothetical protein CBR_g39531 [Chara braunii]|uniref:Uncharacterized protein n=1 Tax=Chara braunii TaxID=69332 RepID=A0A388LRU9_CHABU|nr:hypothetical protein CBR_g39531 [Chara braunii]|eukprot:GBG85068.1 hypothetical protein CBR_g39531 [Chara braunii]
MLWSGVVEAPDHTTAWSGVPEPPDHAMLWSGVVEAPDHTTVWSAVLELAEHGTLWSRVVDVAGHTMGWSGVPEPPDHAMLWSCVVEAPDHTTVWSGVPELAEHGTLWSRVVDAAGHTMAWSGVPEPPDHAMAWSAVPAATNHVMAWPAVRLAAASAPMFITVVVTPLMLGPSVGSLLLLPLPMVRRRQGARPPDGPASSRRQTIRWSGFVEAPDHQMVRRRRGAGPSKLSAQQLLTLMCPCLGCCPIVRQSFCGPSHARFLSCCSICPDVHQFYCAIQWSGLSHAEPSDARIYSARLRTGHRFPVKENRSSVLLRGLYAEGCRKGGHVPREVLGNRLAPRYESPLLWPSFFLRDESGGYYPCGGIKTYSFDKNMSDEEYMRFHLTTCFDIDGHEVPDNYKLVSLHVEKFQDMVGRHKLQAMGQAVLRTTVSVSSPKAVGKSCGEPKTSARMSKSGAASTQAKSVSKSASLLQPKDVSATQAPSHAEYAARVSLTPPGGATDHVDDDENTEEDSRFFNSDGGRWPDGNAAKGTEGDEDE